MQKNNKYFNLKEYLLKIGLYPLTGLYIIIITAIRNMGKSYGTWDFIEKEIWEKYNYTKKIVYIRTNDMKMDVAIKSFNENYAGKYKVVGNKIFKLSLNENGKENISERIHIGDFVNVLNEHNYRSGAGKGNFENYMFAFWDEFNEDTQINTNLFTKFMMLYSTIKRQNNPFYMILVGNKVNANNDIFIKLELDTDNHNLNEDYFQKLIHPKTKDVIGYYIDIGYDTFKDINPEEDIINGLATFDKDTNNLFNKAGFLRGQAYNVILYDKYIIPTKKTLLFFTLEDKIIEYGSFGLEDEFIFFNYVDEKIDDNSIIAFDLTGFMNNKESIALDKDMYELLINNWIIQNKNKLLFFTSFDLKIKLEKVFEKYSNFIR